MKQYETHLQAKVETRNRVNRITLSLIPSCLEALRPFVGQKVLNQGYVKSAKLVAALPFSSTLALHYYISANQYGITLNVKACSVYKNRHGEYGSGCYAEQSVHLADVDGYVLKELNEVTPTFRTDYTVEEVIQARKELREAEAALSHAQSKLFYFGNHDNH